MGEILGLGVTHYPGLSGLDERMSGGLRNVLVDPGLPQPYRDPANWPEQLRREYGDDQGKASAAAHRAQLVDAFRRYRKTLDEFNPDFVLIWGDDQYENFKEDLIPAFSVLIYDDVEVRPWAHRSLPNVWGESADTSLTIKGYPEAAKYLARRLLEEEIDIAYAYRPLHDEGLAHAFLNTVLFLDYDRQGWQHRVVCFPVNCYGRRVISQRGGRAPLRNAKTEGDLDPPSPSPRRCMAVGAVTARILRESPWRVALIASSSWSHAFLTDKLYQLHPDHAADRRLYDALCAGDYETWRKTPLSSLEESGQQELLNWFCLAGAMEALGRKPDRCEFVESWIANSNKVFAAFMP